MAKKSIEERKNHCDVIYSRNLLGYVTMANCWWMDSFRCAMKTTKLIRGISRSLVCYIWDSAAVSCL